MNTNFTIAVGVNHPEDVSVYGVTHIAVKAERGGSMTLHGDEFDTDAIEDAIDQLNQHWEASVEQVRSGLQSRSLQVKADKAQKAADAEAKKAVRGY